MWRGAEDLPLSRAIGARPASRAAWPLVRFPLSARAHKQLASWLACAEVLLRRLLLIEAAALPLPDTRPHVGAPRQRVRRRVEFWPDKPQDWRVNFRCFPVGARGFRPRITGARSSHQFAPPEAASSKRQPRQFRNAWPLAERYEAILRVFENPEPYARRLSRGLRASPLNARKLLYAPPDAPQRIDRFDEVTHVAAQERDRLCDSS
jgi:hypothetical protein